MKKWLLPRKGTKALLMPEDHLHPISKSVIKYSSRPSTLGLPDHQRNFPRRILVPTKSSPKLAPYHSLSIFLTPCMLSTPSSTFHSSNQRHRTLYWIGHNLHYLPLKSTATQVQDHRDPWFEVQLTLTPMPTPLPSSMGWLWRYQQRNILVDHDWARTSIRACGRLPQSLPN